MPVIVIVVAAATVLVMVGTTADELDVVAGGRIALASSVIVVSGELSVD